jgi:predicted metal-dependent HD superfamily phosphohydrolase
MDSPTPAHSENTRDPFRDAMHLRWRLITRSAQHDATFEQLVIAYTAPNRHYHNLAHVYDCLQLADKFRDQMTDSRAVAAAIWFHDAVYNATRPDNEARSADLAERHLRALGAPEPFVVTVHDLILDTRHTAPPTTPDGQTLVDIDLSILGRPAEIYDAYDNAIRREYAHVPEGAYRTGRATVLRSFLARPSIYLTPPFQEQYELRARENLKRSLLNLA